jgi:methyltransferase
MFLFVVVGLIIVQRLLELRLAKRNLQWALEHGGKEHSPEHYPIMVAIHTGWFVSILIEGVARGAEVSSLWPLWVGLVLIAQVARYWIISSLGRYWNTRIVIVPNAKLVRSGPYKFLKHPNYVVVALEIFVVPMIFGAWITAVVFSALNAWLLLSIRIPAEERALRTVSSEPQL